MRAGLGPPPPTKLPIYNCSRVLKLGQCEMAYHIDYHLNVQYGPERKEYPAPWLGSYLHRFDELCHKSGWDDPDALISRVEAEFQLMPEGWEEDKKWTSSVALAPVLAKKTWERYHLNQTWDQILGSEVVFWLEWLGVMWLGTIDCLVEINGLLIEVDKKTSTLDLEDVLNKELNSFQRAIYGQWCVAAGQAIYGLEYGGAMIDYIPTKLPAIPANDPPRKNKDGTENATDVKAIERHARALEVYQSRLQRIRLRQYTGLQYRLDTMGGAVERVKKAEALRSGMLLPLRDGWSRPGVCRGCPHVTDCAHRRTPSAHDYYTRQPDYVDQAREANQ